MSDVPATTPCADGLPKGAAEHGRLAIACFLAEAAYMTLELVAQRVLSPFFGNTSIVWTGIIGVILLSGALGNWLGGRLADLPSLDSRRKAGLLLLLAGVAILPIRALSQAMLPQLSSTMADLRLGAALSAAALFFLPSLFLGMLVPVVTKPFAGGDTPGAGLGRITAVTTLGGIIGTFVGGFALIPSLRSHQVLLVCAATLFFAACIILWPPLRRPSATDGTDNAGGAGGTGSAGDADSAGNVGHTHCNVRAGDAGGTGETSGKDNSCDVGASRTCGADDAGSTGNVGNTSVAGHVYGEFGTSAAYGKDTTNGMRGMNGADTSGHIKAGDTGRGASLGSRLAALPLVSARVLVALALALLLACVLLIALGQEVSAADVTTLSSDSSSGQVIAERDSAYNKIVVTEERLSDSESLRAMRVGRAYETLCYTSEKHRYEPVTTYIGLYDALFAVRPDATNSLIIGGGGYSYPKHYISSRPNCRIDVVELDPQVTELAREYFFLQDLIDEYDAVDSGRLGLITDDGRAYLNSCPVAYDAILNDAFSGLTPPASLTTVEAVRGVHDALTEGGVYLTNVIAQAGDVGEFIRLEVATIMQVFPHVYLLPCSPTDLGAQMMNIMVVATDIDARESLEKIAPYGVLTPAELGIDNSTPVLTDDWCPVEVLAQE